MQLKEPPLNNLTENKDKEKSFNLADPIEWKEYNNILDQIEIDDPDEDKEDRMDKRPGISTYYCKNDYSNERRNIFERLRTIEAWLNNTFQRIKLDALIHDFIHVDKALKQWPSIEQWDSRQKHDTDPMDLAENRNAYLTHISILVMQRNDLQQLIENFKACILELNKIHQLSELNAWKREARKAESILLYHIKNIIKKDNLSGDRYINDFMDRYPLTPSTVTI